MHAGQFMWKFLCILTAVSSPRQLYGLAVVYCFVPCAELCVRVAHTGWRTKCHTIDCIHNIFLLLQKHLTYGTELILIGWKFIIRNYEISTVQGNSVVTKLLKQPA